MNTAISKIGKTYGRLSVLSILPIRKNRNAVYKCVCYCGNEINILGCNLSDRGTKSCGCLKKELFESLITHGKTNTPEYGVWKNVKKRCTNPKCKSYKRYGGRGIVLCDRWLNSFENFIKDMGIRPSYLHSIERIDNNGNYEPGNCKWATIMDQSRNTSLAKKISIDGLLFETQHDFWLFLGMTKSCFDRHRYKLKLSIEEIYKLFKTK